MDDDAATDLRRALEAVTAMFHEGDPVGFLAPYEEAKADDLRNRDEMRRVGLVSALTLLTASLLHDLDRAEGAGTAAAWLVAERRKLA